MTTFSFSRGKYHVDVFHPGRQDSCPCVCCPAEPEAAQTLAACLSGRELVLAAISGMVWEDALSPWPAARAFHTGRDFGGEAEAFTHALARDILPELHGQLGFVPAYHVAAGNSLAGLWSLYACYHTDVFARLVCVSGSLWYDGFLAFLQDNPLPYIPEKAYFSLGGREKMTHNERLAQVAACTQATVALFAQQGTKTIFEETRGGHFSQQAARLARGIGWVLEG